MCIENIRICNCHKVLNDIRHTTKTRFFYKEITRRQWNFHLETQESNFFPFSEPKTIMFILTCTGVKVIALEIKAEFLVCKLNEIEY